MAVLIAVHVVDQVLRGDASSWPFTPALTWFTASLLLYPALLAGLGLLGGRPWARVALAALLLVAAQVPHMGFVIDDAQQRGRVETPAVAAVPRPALKTSLWEVEVETWDAIRSRRNVRSYSGQAIAPQDLDRILEAARRTPWAGNQQTWDFVVCTDPSSPPSWPGVAQRRSCRRLGGDDRAGGPEPR